MDLRTEIRNLQNNMSATDSDYSHVADKVLEELDTNGDGKLGKNDNLNTVWENAFGITDSTTLSKTDIENRLDKVTLPDTDFDDYNEQYHANKKSRSRADGAFVQEALSGYTPNYKYDGVNKILDGLTKDNIVDFIKGHKESREIFGIKTNPEGLIEQLDDEDDGGTITMSTKRHVIKMMLDRAEEKGKTDNDSYRTLKIIYDSYSSGSMSGESDDFNQYEGFSWHSAVSAGIVSGIACGTTTTLSKVVGQAAGGLFGKFGKFAALALGGVTGIVTGVIAGFVDHETTNEKIDKAMEDLADLIG